MIHRKFAIPYFIVGLVIPGILSSILAVVLMHQLPELHLTFWREFCECFSKFAWPCIAISLVLFGNMSARLREEENQLTTLVQIGESRKDKFEQLCIERNIRYSFAQEQKFESEGCWNPGTILYYWIDASEPAISKLMDDLYADTK